MLLLAACSKPQSGSTISFQILHDSEAYAVLQNADGSVISTQTLAPGAYDVSFSNVPDGAVVTALTSETNDGTPAKYAFTAPASVVAGQQFSVINDWGPGGGSSTGFVTITGPCPGNSTTDTISHWSSFRPSLGAQDNGTTTCSASGTFTITAYYSDVDNNGNVQLSLFALSGSTIAAYARLTNISPSQTSLTLASTDWQTSTTADTATVNFAPALATNGTADFTWDKYAMLNGLAVSLAGGEETSSTSTLGATSLTVNRLLASVSGATSYLSSLEFDRENCSSSPCISSYVYMNAPASTLPANQSVTIGTDTWPSLQSFSWQANATTSPVVSYTNSSKFDTAKTIYADLSTTDSTTGATTEWTMISENPANMSGTFTFPQLPSNLQSYIPVPASSGNNANMSITDVPLTAWWFSMSAPSSYNEVDAQTPVASLTTTGLTPSRHTPGPHLPIGGSGLWLR